MKLNGITALDGDGIILEVHLDLQHSSLEFKSRLEEFGFESDPFATFFPLGYIDHITGRSRVLPGEIKSMLPEVHSLVATIMKEAVAGDFALYAEIELVRNIWRFEPQSARFSRVLDSMVFSRSGKFGGAKSDVHVEFPKGEVPVEVREYLSANEFYWVSTPKTPACQAEEIATLQTATYDSGRRVAELLCANPLPGCTAIHLEQKLAMIATNFNLAMPEVINVEQR